MLRPCRCSRNLSCALTVLAAWFAPAPGAGGAERRATPIPAACQPAVHQSAESDNLLNHDFQRTHAEPSFSDVPLILSSWFDERSVAASQPIVARDTPDGHLWIVPPEQPPDDPPPPSDDGHWSSAAGTGTWLVDRRTPDGWSWHLLPSGLIYRSYLAGAHEPRMALVSLQEDGRTLWDATLGGRIGFLRYGDCDPLYPQGWQLDFYGAAIARLDIEMRHDLESTDFVLGVPLTYGVGNWQFKFAYAHLSSHLGDERAIRVPGSLAERVNYVRDGLVFGLSNYVLPTWRLYGEVGGAFHASGGAKAIETQFGTEVTWPYPTSLRGTPFLAVNARQREEHNFGGDVAAQVGWLWRGSGGQATRLGAHYYNGKSSQFQFFKESEEQIGMGLWYDF